MLSVAEDHLRSLNPQARLEVFGQELDVTVAVQVHLAAEVVRFPRQGGDDRLEAVVVGAVGLNMSAWVSDVTARSWWWRAVTKGLSWIS